jgi:phosphatidylinositol alpha-1,6-mannosyltransferase
MKYVIVGEGRMRPTIEQLVKTRGWEDTVVMLGAIRDADVQAWYSASDLLVVPNIPMRFDMEGLGLVALEASARGLPVVASAVDGLHDAVVDGITGYLVEPENPGAFFHGIHSLLTQDAVRRRMSRNGPKVAEEQYAWDSVVTRYVQVLSSLDQQVFSS